MIIFIMLMLAYVILAYGDLKATYHKHSKIKLTVYFVMMLMSYAYGIVSIYAKKVPTPADPIKQAVLWIMGK